MALPCPFGRRKRALAQEGRAAAFVAAKGGSPTVHRAFLAYNKPGSRGLPCADGANCRTAKGGLLVFLSPTHPAAHLPLRPAFLGPGSKLAVGLPPQRGSNPASL